MFTGIIETLGTVQSADRSGSGNISFWIESSLSPELKVDQSVAHNGVCLTVEEIKGLSYKVTAIPETLQKSNLEQLKTGDLVNLERSMVLGARIDGHLVQGHVDGMGLCEQADQFGESWLFAFSYPEQIKHITVPKGSICVNGVSLTVVDSNPQRFSVAIIPYTYGHTNFSTLKKGDYVNLEFDILGKYMAQYFLHYKTLM